MIINRETPREQVVHQIKTILMSLPEIVNSYQVEVPILREFLEGKIDLNEPLDSGHHPYESGYEFINSWTEYLLYEEL